MANNHSRSTAFFDQDAEGSAEPVVFVGKRSGFVPIENLASKDLNPEELCILCEELKKVNDPELAEAVEELLATHSSHPVPSKDEEDGNAFPPLGSESVLVAKIKSPGEVKPHRNLRHSPVIISMASVLLGLGDYEFFILEIDDEE